MTNILTGDISKLALENTNYRKVISTTKHQQLVLMSLKPKEEIGMEVHHKIDQYFRIEKGNAIALIGLGDKQKKYKLKKEYFLIVPAGTYHNIINTGSSYLKLYSIYSPPQHKPGTIHKTKPKND